MQHWTTFERFCFEDAFYREMKTMYTPDAGRDMAYRVAADGLADCLPWFSMVQKRKGYLVFEKRSISEPQTAVALLSSFSSWADERFS